MAAFDTTRTTYGSATAVSTFGSLFSTAFAAFVSWREAAATRKALGSLTDRELEDIGLLRSDLDTIGSSNLIR